MGRGGSTMEAILQREIRRTQFSLCTRRSPPQFPRDLENHCSPHTEGWIMAKHKFDGGDFQSLLLGAVLQRNDGGG